MVDNTADLTRLNISEKLYKLVVELSPGSDRVVCTNCGDGFLWLPFVNKFEVVAMDMISRRLANAKHNLAEYLGGPKYSKVKLLLYDNRNYDDYQYNDIVLIDPPFLSSRPSGYVLPKSVFLKSVSSILKKCMNKLPKTVVVCFPKAHVAHASMVMTNYKNYRYYTTRVGSSSYLIASRRN